MWNCLSLEGETETGLESCKHVFTVKQHSGLRHDHQKAICLGSVPAQQLTWYITTFPLCNGLLSADFQSAG